MTSANTGRLLPDPGEPRQHDKRLLLFDLGGVLVEVQWIESFRALRKQPISDADIASLWPTDPSYLALEKGQISPQRFAEELCRSWSLDTDPEYFLQQFSGWARGFFPGATDLLAELRTRFRLAALSNSSEPHWQYMNRHFALDSHFERAFSSHHLGLRKPDAAIYRRALLELDVRPQEVVFFDDRQENVEGARAVGIDAHQVAGVENLRERLRELGCLT